MKARKRKVYVVSFDNGMAYGDHDVTPLFLVESAEQGETMKAKAAAWIAEQRQNLPACPLDVAAERADAGDPDLTTDEWMELHDKRQAYIKALKPPFGISSLREAVDDNSCGSNGKLVVGEIEFWSRGWSEDAA